MTCSISDCPTDSFARGWCHKHYERWRKHGDPNTVLRWKRKPYRASEIKKMTDIEAAQVGRMIDTDGWICKWGRRTQNSWVIGFHAKTIPALVGDLIQLTGAGRAHPDRGALRWYVSRFRSVLDLAHRIAPWSYKARDALPQLEELARYYDS